MSRSELPGTLTSNWVLLFLAHPVLRSLVLPIDSRTQQLEDAQSLSTCITPTTTTMGHVSSQDYSRGILAGIPTLAFVPFETICNPPL